MSVPGSTVSILDRLRELLELLETLAANRRLLDELSPDARSGCTGRSPKFRIPIR